MPVYVDNIDKTYSQSITFTPSMKNSAVLYGLIIGFLAAFTIATICFYIIFILRYRRLLAAAGQSPDTDNIESQRFCFQFHNNKGEGMAGGGGDQMCAVCLSKFDDEDAIRLLPECKHCFHVKCIDKWLLLHSTCPVCRVKTIIMTGEHEKVKGTSPAVNRHGEGDNVGGGHWTARWFWWVAAEAEDVVFEI